MIRLSLALPLALMFTVPAKAVDVRHCGDLRTTPLSDERGVQSALLQAFAVVNTDTRPVTLTGVRFQIEAGGLITDTRWLAEGDIARAVRQGPALAALAQALPSQLCNGELLADARPATSATLAPGDAVVFVHQPFLWQGDRNSLDVVAVTERDGVASEAQTAIAISNTTARTRALFPLAGRSFVAVAASFHTPHRWLTIEQFAYDVVELGEGGSTHRDDGMTLDDYAAFGRPIRSVADGTVVRLAAHGPDNAAMLKRRGESDDAYLTRLMAAQSELLAAGIEAVMGNHVVIDHGNGEYSVYAHLKQDSVRVRLGQRVTAGETIAALGSSGNSTEPHLHFQMCDTPDMARCSALPAKFEGVRLPLELAPRSIQSGDLVETVR